jgi:hypothetical protein
LRREGYVVGRKRIRRLMQQMGCARSSSGRFSSCRADTDCDCDLSGENGIEHEPL